MIVTAELMPHFVEHRIRIKVSIISGLIYIGDGCVSVIGIGYTDRRHKNYIVQYSLIAMVSLECIIRNSVRADIHIFFTVPFFCGDMSDPKILRKLLGTNSILPHKIKVKTLCRIVCRRAGVRI